jgi:hypothetical protein
MVWSQSELDALRAAFAAGTLRVTYDGRTVEYGDANDLLKRIRIIEREMAAEADGAKPSRSLAAFTKG